MAAIGEDYIDRVTLKSYMGLEVDTYDSIVDAVISSASREVERHTHRQFNKVDSPTMRRFYPTRPGLAMVDDFYTTDGLVITTDDNYDGTFARTWVEDVDYELQPTDGIVEQVPGFPFWKIVAIGSQGFPCHSNRATIRITANWGWESVPAPVVESVKMLASDAFQYKDSRMGVAGADQFGTVVRIKDNTIVCTKLKKYKRSGLFVR